jgi:hypothetical protein
MTRLIVLSIVCTLSNACGNDRAFDRDGAPAVDPTAMSVSKVLEQPTSYLGQRITLAGEIVDVYSPRAFSIVGEQFLENDRLLVVIGAGDDEAERAAVVDRGARVHVSGTLETGASETLRMLNLDPARIPDHVSTPVLVAESVTIAPPR